MSEIQPYLRRKFGRALRKVRTEAGLSHAEASKRLRFGKSRLTRMENGEVIPEPFVLEGMLDRYGVPSCDWAQYEELADEARKRGWWTSYGLPAMGYVALEADAIAVRDYELAYVPGLLQTEDYVRAVLGQSMARFTKQQMDNEVAVRLIRQRRLTSEDNPLALTVIIDETVLYRPIGGVRTMRAQLDHLLMMSELSQVTLHVVPTSVGFHDGMNSSFTLLSFPEDNLDVACIEHAAGALHIEKEEQVRTCKLRFDRLRATTLSQADSAALIERVASEM